MDIRDGCPGFRGGGNTDIRGLTHFTSATEHPRTSKPEYPQDVRARNIRGRTEHGISADVQRKSYGHPWMFRHGCPRTNIRGCSAPELKCVSPRNIRHGCPRMLLAWTSADDPCTDAHGCSVYGGPRRFLCMDVCGYSVHGRPRMLRAWTFADVPCTEVRGCSVQLLNL